MNVARARTTLTQMCHHLERRVLERNVIIQSKQNDRLRGSSEIIDFSCAEMEKAFKAIVYEYFAKSAYCKPDACY